jgi:hypothetical protein
MKVSQGKVSEISLNFSSNIYISQNNKLIPEFFNLEAIIYSAAKNFLLQSFPVSTISSPGWYEDNWYEVNLQSENISCTKEEMRKAAEGHLTTEALMWNQNNQKTISGMSSEDFRLVSSAVYPFSFIPVRAALRP